MHVDRVWTAKEMELLTPDERAKLIGEHSASSLDGLDPEFTDRVKAKSRRIVEERGLLGSDHS